MYKNGPICLAVMKAIEQDLKFNSIQHKFYWYFRLTRWHVYSDAFSKNYKIMER